MDYLGESNVITRVLIGGKQEGQSRERNMTTKEEGERDRLEDAFLLTLRVEEGATSQGR